MSRGHLRRYAVPDQYAVYPLCQDGNCTPTYTTVVCDDLNPATANDRCNGAGVCLGDT